MPNNEGKNEQELEKVDKNLDPLLDDNAIIEVWRICYLANFFVFPLYRHLERAFNITRPEWVIIFCLAHQEPLCAQDIVAKTWQPKNSINRGVKLLTNKGYIEKREDPNDGRRALLSLTQEGWKAYSQTLPYAVTRKERVISCLTREENQGLNQVLLKMCVNLHEHDNDGTNGD